MLKVTFFTQVYHPDIATTALLMKDLAEDLAAAGIATEVVCAQPCYLVRRRAPAHETINGVNVRRVATFRFNKNHMLGRALNAASCVMAMLVEALRTQPEVLLVFNTNPAFLAWVGYICGLLRGHRYVVLVHDLWPELPANMGLVKMGGFLYRLMDQLSRKIFKSASTVVVISERMKNRVRSKCRGTTVPIHVLPNWADSRRVYPVPPAANDMLRKIGLKGRKVVMYSGNLGRYQPLEPILEAAELLRHRRDIVFLLVGDGGKKARLQTMVRQRRLTNVLFLPFQPVHRLAQSLSMADISLLGIYPANEGVVMPSKLYGLLAVGKPIICLSDARSEVMQLLAKYGAGLHCPIDAPQVLANHILHLIDQPERAARLGAHGRALFNDRYERCKITDQWCALLRRDAA